MDINPTDLTVFSEDERLQELRSYIYDRLLTIRGRRVMRPEYGTILISLLGTVRSEEVKAEIALGLEAEELVNVSSIEITAGDVIGEYVLTILGTSEFGDFAFTFIVGG